MDFQELLNHADYNVAETKYSSGAKRYSSVLPPPKKGPRISVQPESVKRFLQKQKAEEEAKAEEARKQKEKLLALRAQSSKNNKKAKIMASRTKDNDFSKIKLTADEIEEKKKVEAELLRKNLQDKVERMRARITMEEEQKLMPKKRKRKSKNGETVERIENNHNHNHEHVQNDYTESSSSCLKNTESSLSHTENVHKLKRPPQPAMSFNDLLKIAEKKQFEPVEIAVEKKEETKLMTKKEKKVMEEELARQRRKEERMRERLIQNDIGKSSKNSMMKSSPTNKKSISASVENRKQPVVIHVNKDVSKSEQDSRKFKIPQKNVPINNEQRHSQSISIKSTKETFINEQKKMKKVRDESKSVLKDRELKLGAPKSNGFKVDSPQATSSKTPEQDQEALTAAIEKKLMEKFEREFAEKMEKMMSGKFAQLQGFKSNVGNEKVPEVSKQIKKEPGIQKNDKRPIEKPTVNDKNYIERQIAMRKQAMQQKVLQQKSKLVPEKKPFHRNPYLDPPRRLLEPQGTHRPPPPRRRIESDDEDEEDDDDDMSSFIDDSQNEEDYSRYIKEIFNYDKSKYEDEDDDDVMETSFGEQLKEEMKSAKLGYLEDLEDIKKEKELLRKKKQKLKK